MTGKDLLDAIGAVDEELLEHCQKTEQITAKNKILWFWYGRKYVSIAACLLIISILGITYWKYNFSGVGGISVNEDTQEMTASSDTCHPKSADRRPVTDDLDGTNSAQAENNAKETDVGLAEDTSNETDQDSKASNNQPNAGTFPDTDNSSDTEKIVPTPKEPESTEILASNDDKAAKADETNNIPPNHSRNIKIEAVKKIPEVDSKPAEGEQQVDGEQQTESPTNGIARPALIQMPSAKNILAEKTVILRGTVKKIQHFHATGGKIDVYFSVVSVKVKEAYRKDGKGNPKKGKVCKLYLPDSVSSENRILEKLTKGKEVILMPYIADAKTGIRKKGNFFAFLDVSDYYFDAETAESHLFLKTNSGVLYDTNIYDIPYSGKKVTLNDVGNYIRKMLRSQ